MNGTNILRTAIALTIPTLLFACTRSEAERREDVREAEGEAREARAEANAERREETAERREDVERRTEPRIQPNEPEATKPVTNAAEAVKGLTAASVKSITEARCMREEKCGNIGPGQDYASTSACQQKISADWRDELNAYDCPGGVVAKEFNECIEEIKNEDCSSPFDTLGRVVACRSSDLCKALE
jgi:recombination DNA repair RAD52 pathway protein